MEGIFALVITTTLYASVVGLIILLLKRILSNRLNPKWHFLIWTVLIIKLIIPIGPECSLSIFNAVPQAEHIPVKMTYQPVLPTQSPVELTQPLFQSNPTLNYMESSVKQNQELISHAEKAIPFIWLLGALILILWILFTNYFLHQRLRKSKITAPDTLYVILEKCKRRMGINRNIEIIIQDTIDNPSIFGVITPKILISPKTLYLDQKEINYIFLHELAHFKRKDLLVNYLLLGLQVIHWFNPVIWYCFRIIRRDMEVAADHEVLSVLREGEKREYGKALLTVLESFNTPKFLPKLVGMVDDKKSITRRIRMIKTAEMFQRKRLIFLFTGVVCVVLLSLALLTNPLTSDGRSQTGETIENQAETMLGYKNPYIGDASNVGNLLSQLSYAEYRQGMSLQTEKTPYGITVKYELTESDNNISEIELALYKNATLMFALINNLELIDFNLITNKGEHKFHFSREMIQSNYVQDLRDYTENNNDFQVLLNSTGMKVVVNPQIYTPTMSSTPGIRFSVEYQDRVDEVRYTTSNGTFLSRNASTLGSNVKASSDSSVYWNPRNESGNIGIQPDQNQIPIFISLYRDNLEVAEKRLIIQYDGGFYSVEPGYDVLVGENIHQAISRAILEQGNYYKGEVATEGHVLLEIEENNGVITAYTIASFGYFGFENGVFTTISGSGAIPTVITFKRDELGRYTMLSYQEPLDGAGYLESLKKMFPEKYWEDVLPGRKGYPGLVQQQEAQAAQYLNSIGRKAPISTSHVEKQLMNISSISASNKFAEFAKFDPFLNSCPYWIGTREEIENGVRYIYETKQSRTDDGYDLIIFSKRQEDGALVQEARYKIVGDEPQLISS